MKTQTTKKHILASFKNVISVPYCAYQSILRSTMANLYTAGVNGWNCDIFIISPDTCLTCGYRPFGHMLTKEEADILKMFNDICALHNVDDNSRFEALRKFATYVEK